MIVLCCLAFPLQKADAQYIASDLTTIGGKTHGYYEVDILNGEYKEEFKIGVVFYGFP